MRHLPAIVCGPGRWVLPIADRSAALLAEVLLAGQRVELSPTLAEVLRNDPPLTLWAVVSAVGREQFYPTSVSDTAAWLTGHVLAVLRWPEPTVGSALRGVPGSGVMASVAAPRNATEGVPYRELVCESLCLGEVAAQLASKAPVPDRERAILTALVHNAPAWFARSAESDCGTVPEPFSRWLAASPAEAVETAVLAGQILAGDRPAPDLDLAVARRRAEQAARDWATPLAGAGDYLPALTARLARLEQLEHRFHQTLEHEKLEAMAELAAGAGHEINNPLAIIAGRAQLFLQDETHPERRREAAIIVAQVKRAHEMIADLRLFARPPRPEPQPFDLAALLDRVLGEPASQAAERATALVRTGHSGPLPVELDPVQVSVAVQAVVRNALEAIGHDGRIEVGLEGDDRSVTIRVADNGPGIAPEYRPHIFDPFFSARQAGRGLGMGLSKCWRIVTNHGGHIEVESRPGQGATFTIRLPRQYPPAPEWRL